MHSENSSLEVVTLAVRGMDEKVALFFPEGNATLDKANKLVVLVRGEKESDRSRTMLDPVSAAPLPAEPNPSTSIMGSLAAMASFAIGANIQQQPKPQPVTQSPTKPPTAKARSKSPSLASESSGRVPAARLTGLDAVLAQMDNRTPSNSDGSENDLGDDDDSDSTWKSLDD